MTRPIEESRPTLNLASFDGAMLDGLQFVRQAYDLFEQIRAEPEGVSRLRMRDGHDEKRLIEEVLPIARWITANYRLGFYTSVQWVDGSQTFDARFERHGAVLEHTTYARTGHLEVVSVVHKNDRWMREQLEREGGTFGLDGLSKDRATGVISSVPTAYQNQSYIGDSGRLMLARIGEKAAKPYPENTTLVVRFVPPTVFLQSEWQAMIVQVRDGMPMHTFDSIFVFHESSAQQEELRR